MDLVFWRPSFCWRQLAATLHLHPPTHTHTAPPTPMSLWNSSRIIACVLFLPILRLLRHLAVAPLPAPLCPLPALLINRRWYWWELNAGKWLPVKAPRTPASRPARYRAQAWLACWPFTRPVNRPLCSLACLVLHSVCPSICLSMILFLSVPTSALVLSIFFLFLFWDPPGSLDVSLLCVPKAFLFVTCWYLSI